MRGSWAGAVVLGLGLACGGPAVEIPEVLPAEEPTPEPGEEPAPAAEDDPEPAPVGEATALVWLADDGGRCSVLTRALSGGEPTNAGRLPVPCPDTWRIALPPADTLGQEGDSYLVYTADHTWKLDPGGVVDLGTTPDGIDLIATDNSTILACGEPDVTPVEKDGHFTWTFDGQTYTLEADIGATLVRTFQLTNHGWVQQKVAPIPLYEGMSAPFCSAIDGWPRGTHDLVPVLVPVVDGFRDATEDESAALQAFDVGSWHLTTQGGVAARTDWFEGVIFLHPVLSRTSPTEPWKVVAELAAGSTATYDTSGPYLLIDGEDRSVLRDVRTGKDVWTSPKPAVFLREGQQLPDLSNGAEPEPDAPEHPHAKAKSGKGGKAKGKAKAH